MKLIIEKLKGITNRSLTTKNYLSIWKKFHDFIMKLDPKPKSWEEKFFLYGAYLVDKGIQSSTLKSYKSTIKHILCTDIYPWDDGKLLLSTITGACKIINDWVCTRLPIRIGLLELILFEIQRIFDTQPYLSILYKAMIALGYYGLFRIGEIAKSQHCVRARNIFIGKNKDKILIILYSSKTHSKESNPQKIKIEAINWTTQQKKHSRKLNFCPFQLTQMYMRHRVGFESDNEQFFVFSDKSPVLPNHLCFVLKSCIKRLDLNDRLYNCHSLRTGRSTDLYSFGIQVDAIKRMGRWKSNAIFKYLKP